MEYEEKIKNLTEALNDEEKNAGSANQELEKKLDDLKREYEKNMTHLKKELAEHRWVLKNSIVNNFFEKFLQASIVFFLKQIPVKYLVDNIFNQILIVKSGI